MEKAFGKDSISVGAAVPVKEQAHYKAVWRIEKYKGDFRSRIEAEAERSRLLALDEDDMHTMLCEAL